MITHALEAGALLLTGLGLLCAAALGSRAGPRQALQMAVELWLSAALLRLAAPSWDRLAAAAALIAVRQLLAHGWAVLRRP